MRNIWLIARREYLERIRTKSFIVMTVLIPAIMVAVTFGGSVIGGKGKAAAHILVVTQDPEFGLKLQSELEAQKQAKITADLISPPGSDTRDRLNREVTARDLDGYLWVTPSPPIHPATPLNGSPNPAPEAAPAREPSTALSAPSLALTSTRERLKAHCRPSISTALQQAPKTPSRRPEIPPTPSSS
jgi:ABC-2 type transport system permease protein